MKTPLKILFVVSIFVALGSYIAFSMIRPTYPPKGYGVACDGNGHFAVEVRMDDNAWCICPSVNGSSHQEIVDREWGMFIAEEKARKLNRQNPDYNFKSCE